ncbi:hypothetical protein BCL79_0270 [Stenotrophomonas rhizophila]|uniref:Uncharacterized protein n=1 Tax=Stenotrophomonas rhizophila TaxID=216778 RepID=A0A498CDE6_9GAMM|nr:MULTISPECIES: hypothetical protein [Stenotrophomonas]RLK55899.1 hypothetical protein BCL79_0270 [Stenotrophomonas rhizophila]
MELIRSLTMSGASGEPVLIVLPSTEIAINEAVQYAQIHEMAIIGEARLVPSAMRPATYFASCSEARNAGRRPASAFLFTDQFVDAPESSLLVGAGDRTEYLGTTELIALGSYGLQLQIWTEQGFRLIAGDAATSFDGVVLALQAYYIACDRLGTAWLVRTRQERRRPEVRRANAVRRIRGYESSLMQELGGAPMSNAAHGLLQRLGVLRTELLRSSKEMGP